MTRSPFVLTIFGATGDLTHRKLMPALYYLFAEGLLPERMFLVGVGRRKLTQDQFREHLARAVQDRLGDAFDLDVWERLMRTVHYEQGYFEEEALYGSLRERLAAFDEELKACVPRIFYLATPPKLYETILGHLDVSELAEGCGHGTNEFTRVLIEKPFGKDLATARELEKLLASTFAERQIYRIDHYLGKETVQNILAFRFANGIFEPTWNHAFVDHVQITLAEKIGIGTRSAFYEGVGALRDVVQNHVLQMLALVAMERPSAFTAEAIRDARSEAIKRIAPVVAADIGSRVVRAQYAAGEIDGEDVRGYTDEEGVAQNSQTETFVALKLGVDTPRWQGVPFYIRSGKRLERRVAEISLHFKKPVQTDGNKVLFQDDEMLRNVLAIRIQPDEGIGLRLMGKRPGFDMKLADNHMDFWYKDAYKKERQPRPYERLLLDAIRGDQTLFARTDGIEASWELMTQVLEGWQQIKPEMHTYMAGSWGPKAAEDLIEKDKRHWFLHED